MFRQKTNIASAYKLAKNAARLCVGLYVATFLLVSTKYDSSVGSLLKYLLRKQ